MATTGKRLSHSTPRAAGFIPAGARSPRETFDAAARLCAGTDPKDVERAIGSAVAVIPDPAGINPAARAGAHVE